jgi:hypothetical protein
MIKLISKGNHLANSWPIARETSACSQNINPFKLIKGYRFRLEELRVLFKDSIEFVPGIKDVIVLLLTFMH